MSPKHDVRKPINTPSTETSAGTNTGQTGSNSGQSSPKTGRSSTKTGQTKVSEQGEKSSPSPPDVSGDDSTSVVCSEPPKVHLLPVLAALINHMKYTHQETRMETLRWLIWLQQQLPKRVCRIYIYYTGRMH